MQTNAAGRIVIAGGSGFVGRSLAQHLVEAGYDVVILSRRAPGAGSPGRHVPWDARTLGPWVSELDGAAGLVNLAGRNVDCRKTPDHVDEIVRSRVEATRVLGEAVRAVAAPPDAWVQMSTAHIYGDPPQAVCTERSATGYGVAPFVGRAWEAAFDEALLPEQRGVVLRTSFVVGRDRGAGCGALGRLVPLARCGFGGRTGSGRQGMSWIHERDLNRIIERALLDGAMHGVYVASAPQPVAQIEFSRTLRRVLGMPIGLPAPGWLVRLGARWVLSTDPELALYGRFVVSERLAELGFNFDFPRLDAALADVLTHQAEMPASTSRPAGLRDARAA